MIGIGAAAICEWIPEQCAIAAAADKPFGVGLLAWAVAEQFIRLAASQHARSRLSTISAETTSMAESSPKPVSTTEPASRPLTTATPASTAFHATVTTSRRRAR